MKWRNQAVRTLLVDLDGTLLESRQFPLRMEFVVRSLIRFKKHGGWTRSFRFLKKLRAEFESPLEAERSFTNAERAARAFGREMGMLQEVASVTLHSEVTAVFPYLKRHFYPVQGAREFLEWARPRYRLILATNPVWPLEQVKLRLEWAGIDPSIFTSITHSGRMHACKPTAEYYRELLEQEGLEASECALIGDDVRKDLPATQVGISVFILTKKKSLRGLSLPNATAQAVSGNYAFLTRLLEEVHP